MYINKDVDVCKYVTGEKCEDVEDLGVVWKKTVKTWC